jgi:hypothetical protein
LRPDSRSAASLKVSEIDLIPADYRLDRRRESAFGMLATAAGAALAAGLLTASGFAWAANRAHAELDSLELARRASDQQHTELANLQGERARLEQQWARLQALRGGDDVGSLFVLIDRTLPAGDVWFDRWELQRAAGELAPARSGAAQGMVPSRAAAVDGPGGVSAPIPQGERGQVRIAGQARDHGALSRFVRGLYESPEVQDVHLERTMLRRYTTTSVIAFELAILLKGDA